MFRTVPIVAAFLACLLATHAWSAEIPVSPGDGTLYAAVESASPGDTLVLQEGVFTGDVPIPKSLTIRPVNRGTFAFVVGTMSVGGEGARITVQGLKFAQNFLVNAQVASVRLLENDFAAGSILIYGPIGSGSTASQGEPALVIVGNTLASGYISEGGGYGTNGTFYIAGNTLFSGSIGIWSPAWIVGNDLRGGVSSVIHAYGIFSRILANRVHSEWRDTWWNHSPYTPIGVIHVNSSYSVVANNIIEVQDSSAEFDSQIGITTIGPGYAAITNNVIRGMPTDSDRVLSYAIYSSSPVSRVSGNIIADFSFAGDDSALIAVSSISQDVNNNLCFRGSEDCPAGDGNLNADPKFIDLVDYRLAPNSPAINTGPSDYALADLDRSRNDMGAQGGPWSIGQYDAQRRTTNYSPYVYPMVRSDWYWNPDGGVSGSLEVQALGVARLR